MGIVAWPDDHAHYGKTILDARQGRKDFMRLSLIPVGNRVEIVGAVIGVAMLDRGLEGPGEGDGRIEMEAVDRGLAAHTLASLDGCAVASVGESVRTKAPGP